MTDTATITSYDNRIRGAYRRIIAQRGGQPGDYVTLTELRPEVGGHRDHVDAALRRMGRGDYPDPGVHLVPQANQKILCQLDRAAAVELGGQQLHLISIR